MRIPKYVKGDVVKLSNTFPDCMNHFFGRDCLAIVMSDNIDNISDDEDREVEYSLFIKGYGECAWYQESLVVDLVDTRRLDLINEWKKEHIELKEKEEYKQLQFYVDHINRLCEDNPNATVDEIAEILHAENMERLRVFEKNCRDSLLSMFEKKPSN